MINALAYLKSHTLGHSDRVGIIAQELAIGLGYSVKEAEIVFAAGLLHDVGKADVPNEILKKPGPLTDQEFDVIKRHPQRGFEILNSAKEFKVILPGILYHHESYDGTGYPHGLKEKQIPELARILSVADSFDAMTSDRPYRTGLSYDQVEHIFIERSGIQWDPLVVSVLLKRIKTIIEITECYSSLLEDCQFEEDTLFFDEDLFALQRAQSSGIVPLKCS